MCYMTYSMVRTSVVVDVFLEIWLRRPDTSQSCFTGVSPLSPLLKTILRDSEPAAMSYRGRASLMHRIEQRFRFLAVGPLTFLNSASMQRSNA